jgi:hypothetical protein
MSEISNIGVNPRSATSAPVVMRRSRRLAATLVAAFLLATLGPRAAEAGNVFQVRLSGGVALAAWTTCPEWRVGLVCTDTEVIASDSATSEIGTPGAPEREAGPYLILRRFVYEVVEFGDDGLEGRPLVESFGGTDQATVAIRPRLEAAVAAATVPMRTCRLEDEDQTCSEETLVAQVEWTGMGELLRLDEREVVPTPTALVQTYTMGWQRVAAADGTIDGATIPGTLIPGSAVLFNVRQGELRAFHGPPVR